MFGMSLLFLKGILISICLLSGMTVIAMLLKTVILSIDEDLYERYNRSVERMVC